MAVYSSYQSTAEGNNSQIMTQQASVINDILANYVEFINQRPQLISLLYDIDLLPEQIEGINDAIHLAALCDVWLLGETNQLQGRS